MGNKKKKKKAWNAVAAGEQPQLQVAEPVGNAGDVMGKVTVIRVDELRGDVNVRQELSYLVVAMRDMCGGLKPAQFLERVGVGVKKKTCDVKWGKGSWLYHCKDCEADPMCALCVECFQEEKHKGHDYSLARAGGGCCDCGDPSAWNPQTFCDRHSVKSDESDTVLAAALAAFEKPLEATCRVFQSSVEQCVDAAALSTHLSKACNWATYLALLPSLFGDGISPVVTRVLVSSGALAGVCAVDRKVPRALQKILHDLYFAYLGCYAFKEALSKQVCSLYVDIVKDGAAKRSDALLEFSVQLFTNPSIGLMCVRQERFFDKMAAYLVDLLKSAVRHDDVTGKTVLDADRADRPLKPTNVLRVLADMRYLLQTRDVCAWLIQDTTAWTGLVKVCAAMHGGLWLKRKTGAHVMFEKPGYQDVMLLDSRAWEVFDLLMRVLLVEPGCCAATLYPKLSEAIWEPHLKKEIATSNSAPFVEFDDSQQPVTVNLALSRLLALVLQSGCVVNSLPLDQVAPFLSSGVVALALGASIAQSLRFLSMVEAGLWKRNGYTAAHVASWKTSPDCTLHSLDREIFLLRCCMSVCSPRDFLSMLTAQFSSAKDASPVIGQQAAIFWLIVVCADAVGGPLQWEHVAKREIVHMLAGCGGSAPRTRLAELLPDQITESKDFDSVLQEVAIFRGNVFVLKPELWDLVDPYFPHYMADIRQTAEEACVAEYNKKLGTKWVSVLPRPVLSSAVFAAQQVRSLLSSRDLWEMLLHRLDSVWIAPNAATTTTTTGDADAMRWRERLIQRVLDVVYLCVQVAGDSFRQWCAASAASTVAAGSLLDAVVYLASSSKESAFIQSVAQRLLPLLQTVTAATASAATAAACAESAEEKKARLRDEAKERQRLIREKMQAQRDAFAAKNKVDLEKQNGASPEGDDERDECVVCREAQSDPVNNPLCRMVLAQRWGVMGATTAADDALSSPEEAEVKKAKLEEKQQPADGDEAEEEVVVAPELRPLDADSHEVLRQKETARLRLFATESDHRGPRVLVRACAHLMHLQCYQLHVASLARRGARENNDAGLDVGAGEFCCPLCGYLCNSVVPIATSAVALPESFGYPQWSAAVEQWLTSTSTAPAPAATTVTGLAILQMRLGMLIWKHPLATESLCFLWDAIIAAVFCQELTNDGSGIQDAMLRPIWDGVRAVFPHLGGGDADICSVLCNGLRDGSLLASCDPFFAIVRLVASLPHALRNVHHVYTRVVSSVPALRYERTALVARVACLHELLFGQQQQQQQQLDDSRFVGGVFVAEHPVNPRHFPSVRALTFSLHLPKVLQDKAWFRMAIEWQCPSCNTTPASVGMCILCGQFACMTGPCCQRGHDREGECSRHGRLRHSGTSLWLDVKRSTVLILRPGGGCIWSKAVYLDHFGEPDEGLVRGRPLILRDEMVEELRRRYICGSLVDLTVNTGKRLMLAGWHMF